MNTYSFDTFWSWLLRHPNCILRVGSVQATFYDDSDFHWHFASEGELLYIQIIRGKRLCGELVVDPEQIAYVQYVGEEAEGEHLFDCVVETENERLVSHYFVLTHEFDEEEMIPSHERAVH